MALRISFPEVLWVEVKLRMNLIAKFGYIVEGFAVENLPQ